MPRLLLSWLVLAFATVVSPIGSPQGGATAVSGTVSVSGKSRHVELDNVVVWLKALREGGTQAALAARPRMVQQNKQFSPRLLVVPVGSAVEFPNRDPFFHNVFSMYDGKRFDLGLYEAGTSRSVTFSKPGVSFIFCNIHPEMSGVIMAVDTPYYAASDRDGRMTIPEVPYGRYRLFVWHERYQPERAGEYPREIVVSAGSATLGQIRLVESDQVIAPHKNKYGQDYVPPPASSPIYKKKSGG